MQTYSSCLSLQRRQEGCDMGKVARSLGLRGLRTGTGRLILAVVLVTAAVFLVLTLFAGPALAVGYSSEEIAVVQLINQYRVSQGLKPLLVSDMISEACERHSSDMGKYAFFDHYTHKSDWFAQGASPWDRMAASGYNYNTYKAENIAAGYSTAAGVFAGWKSSDGHNRNMLNPNYKVIGVGLVHVPGSPYGYYWTTDFGGYIDATARDASTLSSGSSATPASGDARLFTDVGPTTPYAAQITLLARQGIINGYSDGTFRPYNRVTRQQFAKMIVLALGYRPAPVTRCSFRDVPVAGGGVCWAA